MALGLRVCVANLLKGRSGNATIFFAISFLIAIIIIGATQDVDRHQTFEDKMQHAVNVAVVSTARSATNPNIQDAQLNALAQEYFDAAIKVPSSVELADVAFYRNGDQIHLQVDGMMRTNSLSLLGQSALPLSSDAMAIFDKTSAAEIALVLDTSFSMTGPRLEALQSAASEMIDTLIGPQNNAIKMSIVPFATYVNVGTDKRGEPWLSVEPDRTGVSENCTIPEDWYQSHCRRESYECARDGVARTCKKWVCLPGDIEHAPQVCSATEWNQSWHGCVKSRKSPLNIADQDYLDQPIIGIVTRDAAACPAPIQELSSDAYELKSAVQALTADQDTYIASGLMWGLRTLSASAPFDEAEPYAETLSRQGRKALVLMSDGANTRSPTFNGLHSGRDQRLADQITEDVCKAIKSEGIELYTIAFEIEDEDTKKLLRQCATQRDFYFDARNAEALQKAFEKISTNFARVTLADSRMGRPPT